MSYCDPFIKDPKDMANAFEEAADKLLDAFL